MLREKLCVCRFACSGSASDYDEGRLTRDGFLHFSEASAWRSGRRPGELL